MDEIFTDSKSKSKWSKTPVGKEAAKELNDKYGVDPLTASIFIRRGITSGEDIKFFLEDDKRFLHNPFEFHDMEDAVDRITQAKEEGEIVFIFGDRDVDGITSTTLLYEYLVSIGIQTQWKVPSGNEPYGLTQSVIDDVKKSGASLLITVDCGISNAKEIAYASEAGIDVIVLDHHNPPEQIPSPAVIINPKCEDSGYPFKDISGCAVVYKVLCALRFSKSDFYKNEVCLLTIKKANGANTIECLKTQNLIKKDFISETVTPHTLSFQKTRLFDFLQGQPIFVWDKDLTLKLLKETFDDKADFNLTDLRPQIASDFPALANLSLLRLKKLSKIAKYNPKESSEIYGFFNIFVTFIRKQLKKQFPGDEELEEKELQLTALAALADVMPLKNENRILVRKGIESLNNGKARSGLAELLSKMSLAGKRLSSVNLSWNIVPALNATGRMGQPQVAVELFTEKDPDKINELADSVLEMNRKRKDLLGEAYALIMSKGLAQQSIKDHSGKLCVIVDERIHRGVAGILSGRLMQEYKVPAITVTFADGLAIGSMRSCRGFSALPFLSMMSDIFTTYGGHDLAAGFSFDQSRTKEFKEKLKRLSQVIELKAETETVKTDAELPAQYLTPDVMKVVDRFEPYGEQNRELTFMSKKLRISDALIMGKTERMHLKLTFDCGKTKWPAVFWNEADRLHKDIEKGDLADVIYRIERNQYNGFETPQMVIIDIRRSR